LEPAFHFGAGFLLRLMSCACARRFRLLLAETVIYLIGTFGITIFGNVPLNNTPNRFDLKTATGE
jgi:uncharacterized membrane protein